MKGTMVVLLVLLATRGIGFSQETGLVKGISWCGSYLPPPDLLKEAKEEAGVVLVRPTLIWNEVEPEILEPMATLDEIAAEPIIIDRYFVRVNWWFTDNLVNSLSSQGFEIIGWVGQGFIGMLPNFQGQPATPDILGKEFYLGCLYRHVRAVVRRYREQIRLWQIEGELNEARLAVYFGHRQGGAWADDQFLTEIIKALARAVKEESPDAVAMTSFHTNIPSYIHHDLRPLFVCGSQIAGSKDWLEWLTEWQGYLDIIGIDVYVNYITAEPVGGLEVGERVELAKKIVPGKQVIVLETAYPVPRQHLKLREPVDFTEEKQAKFLEDALLSSKEAGASAFCWFTLQSQGIVGPPDGYTEQDLQMLQELSQLSREGDAEALFHFFASNFIYCAIRLPIVLQAVEGGFGLVRGDGTKRPAYFVFRDFQ